jgi:hypothetical protein
MREKGKTMITKIIQLNCDNDLPHLLAAINVKLSPKSIESLTLNKWRIVEEDFHLTQGIKLETIFAGQRIRLVKRGDPSDLSIWEVESPPSFINERLERFFSHKTGVFFDKDGISLNGYWHYLNALKELTVQIIPEELWKEVKKECDDLFRQASNGVYTICPGWIIGGFGCKY